MKLNRRNKPLPYGRLSTGLFLAMGLFLLWQSRRAPIGDYANYYYASRLLAEGQFSAEVYEPYTFNRIANRLSTEPVFVNYTPVPPVSVPAYLPFALINRVELSKKVFSLLGLLSFCLAYFRLVRHLEINGQWWLLILPVLCYSPMLNNFHQGQSYLLLLALLMEGFLQWQRRRVLAPALLCAIAIALKLFPAILLLFLLFERDFRSMLLTLACSAALSLLPTLLFSPSITETYFLDIVPRLFRGEINDPFTILYQSGRTFFLKIFVEDYHLNPNPIANLPRLAFWSHNLFQALVLFVIVLLMQGKKHRAISEFETPSATLPNPPPQFACFALAFLGGLLLTGYGSSYSLMLLLLPALALPALIRNPTERTVGWILLALAANVPVYLLHGLPTGLQFPRLYALLALLALLLWRIRPVLRPATLGLIALLFAGKGLLSPMVFPTEGTYYQPDGRYGIIYDYEPKKGGLKLRHFNEHGAKASLFATRDSIRFSPKLKAAAGQIFWEGKQITHSKSQKRRPALLNERYILYLSDEGRGVGFYTLRKIPLPWSIKN